MAMKALKCTGVEATVQECAWSDPDAACMTHLSDSVIFCTSKKPGEAVAEGSLRLIGASGPHYSGVAICKLRYGGRRASVVCVCRCSVFGWCRAP